MKHKKLKVGKIPYANLFPIFYYLEKVCDNSRYKFFKGVPSKLNTMLRNGEIDISPSSSIEYLKNKSKYKILPCFSISSSGPIRSIMFFSKSPLHGLDGKTVAVSSESDTSVVLLKIILQEFLSIRCRFETITMRSIRNILTSFPAMLHIGDNAMIEAGKYNNIAEQHGVDLAEQFTGTRGRGNRTSSSLYIYDLGDLWDKYTGLPFVYALCITGKKALAEKEELVHRFSSDLAAAKEFAQKNLPRIAREAPQKKWLDEKELIDYWKIISYDFTGKHMEGLNLFEKLAVKL